ncbi:hypothetical protein [Caenimonas soli]|uniref:hypothetical protein n=1 Tax=Caenimonas soli TaxID=2735555 RepID=UPI001554D8EB|nr:hypothetical protein [Caenimonas soli]NPC58085.1 hypothetical protein [Caenimonas soli]
MELFLLAALVVIAAWILKARDQRRRVALLGGYLAKYQIEKHMQTLTQGYLRALGADDPQRSEPIWNMLRSIEQELCSQFKRFAADFSRAEEADTRVSKLPIYIPFAARLFPNYCFDMRQALAIHARGIAQAVEGSEHASPKETAFTMSAELFLMQHTCHWFCKSKTVASARMLARHKTPYAQLVASVAPSTRAAYCALVAAG